MNKRGLFGISITLLVIAFILGLAVGGYFILKSEGVIQKFTGLFTSDNSDSLSGLLDNSDTKSEDLVFEGLNGSLNDSNLSVN